MPELSGEERREKREAGPRRLCKDFRWEVNEGFWQERQQDPAGI